MNHTYHIKMRTTLWVMLGVACFAFVPSVAFGGWMGDTMCACPGRHKPLGNNANCEDACYGRRSSSGGNSAPSYDNGAARRAQEAAEADAEAERQRQHAEAERAERERQAEEKRQAEIKRQKDAAFIRDRDAAANSLKGSTGSAMDQLKGLAGADSSGLKGSGFDTGNSGLKGLRGSDPVVDNRNEPAGLGGQSNFKEAIAKPGKPLPSGDPMVVDARNVPRDGAHLTDQVPELKNSPAADRITKGFQAVINHDWQTALVWWQSALNRDPNNAALKRSVDLAQWMVDRRKTTTAGPATPLGAAIYSASRGDSEEAIRQFERVKKENPAIAVQVDSMINALQKRQAKDAKDAKVAAYWSGEIKKGTQKMVDEMFETGMNRLSVGDEKGAQESFNDADFFGGMSNVRPSQLPALKSGKTK